jgi:hypothetical protein
MSSSRTLFNDTLYQELKEKGKRAAVKGISHWWGGLQKQTCDMSEKKSEPLREVQRLERRRLGNICRKVRISRVCSE